MNKKITIIFLTGALALASGSCTRSKAPMQQQAAVQVGAYTVSARKVSYYDSYPGTVAALNQTEIHSQVSGYVTGIFFREGSHISKGQKLYEIDRTKYLAAFNQAKANVGIAEANQVKARRDADRYTALNEQNAVARQVYDDAITNLENAKMQVIAASAAVISAQTDYNYSQITAPYSGTIGFSSVKTGAYIVPGQTLLTTISSNDPVGVDFIVDEKSIPEFASLREKEVKESKSDPDSTFGLVLPDNTNYGYFGRISVIDRAVDNQSGTIKIRLVFPNKDEILKPGMNCGVRVLNSGSGEHLVVPYKALIEQMSEYFVYRIDSGRVKIAKIEPGLVLGQFIEVKKGLSPGDNIVVDGIQKVFNGSRVLTAANNPGGQAPAGQSK
jgi:RND family efflux transporter MFP subunit